MLTDIADNVRVTPNNNLWKHLLILAQYNMTYIRLIRHTCIKNSCSLVKNLAAAPPPYEKCEESSTPPYENCEESSASPLENVLPPSGDYWTVPYCPQPNLQVFFEIFIPPFFHDFNPNQRVISRRQVIRGHTRVVLILSRVVRAKCRIFLLTSWFLRFWRKNK